MPECKGGERLGNISDGLPLSREDWPQEVLHSAAQFGCGDVVQDPPYFYFADPAYAVLDRTKRYKEGSHGPELIDASGLAAPFGIVTSQTCDVGEIDFQVPSKPFVQISPVFDGAVLDGSLRKLLKKGTAVQAFLYLPALENEREGFWVADFRLEMPVEKSWLVGRIPLKGFTTEAEARMVPKVVGQLRNRPAWAESVNKSVGSTLMEALKDLKSANRGLYEAVTLSIDEIGVKADSMLNPRWIEVMAFSHEVLEDGVRDWWETTTDRIREAADGERLKVQATGTASLDTIPVSHYRQYVTANLSRHSPQ